MKLVSLKTTQPISIGPKAFETFKSVDFDLSIEGQFVTIRHKETGIERKTPVANIAWCSDKEDAKTDKRIGRSALVVAAEAKMKAAKAKEEAAAKEAGPVKRA